ncbi:MAG: hypothetical protein ACW7DV_17675, partial [Paraglaciecola chathamensis]
KQKHELLQNHAQTQAKALGANIMYRRYPDNQFMNLVMCSNTSIDVKNIADTIDKWYFSE